MYVSSANYEGISNSMLEALGMGIPTIVTDCPAGGERMFIEHMVNGLLVRVGDAEGLYRSMKLLIEDEKITDSFSRRSPSIKNEINSKSIMRMWSSALE